MATLFKLRPLYLAFPVVQFLSWKCRRMRVLRMSVLELPILEGEVPHWCFWFPKKVVHLSLEGLELLLAGTWVTK